MRGKDLQDRFELSGELVQLSKGVLEDIWFLDHMKVYAYSFRIELSDDLCRLHSVFVNFAGMAIILVSEVLEGMIRLRYRTETVFLRV